LLTEKEFIEKAKIKDIFVKIIIKILKFKESRNFVK